MIHKLYSFLFQADPICDALLLIVLFVRRRAASFPFFTASTIADAAVFITLIYAGHHSADLFYQLLWPLKFIQQTLLVLVACELAMHVFRPTGAWAPDVRKPLVAIGSGGVIVAFFIAWLARPALHTHSALMTRIDCFFCVLLNILFVGLLILSSIVGLPWKTHAAKIAQVMCAGWFFTLLVELVDSNLSLPTLLRIYLPLVCVNMTLGLAGMLYLLITLYRDEPTPPPLPTSLRNHIYTLQQQAENELVRIRLWGSD